MTIAIGYTRQSLGRAGEDEDTSLSLDAQENAIRSYCSREGWTLKEVIRDHDLKGYDPTRPGIQKMLATVGSDIVVIVFMLSRLARDNVMQETIYRQIRTRGGRLVSVTEPHAEDDLVRGILGVINEAERIKMGRMLKIAFEERFRRGLPHGQPPYGYRKVNGSFEPDPETAPTVRMVFEQAADGASATAIARALNEGKVPTSRNTGMWDTTQIYRMLRNPTYVGALRYRDETYWPDEGTSWHEPIITQETWDRTQREMAARKKHQPRSKIAASPFDGLIFHECGAHAYQRPNGQGSSEHRYIQYVCSSLSHPYHCAFERRSISVLKVEAFAARLLALDLATLPHAADAMVERAQGTYEARQPGVSAERAILQQQFDALTQKIKRAETLWLEDMRSIEWFKAHEGEMQAEQQRLLERMSALPSAINISSLRRVARLFSEAHDDIEEYPPETVAALLREVGHLQFGPSGITIVYDYEPSLLIPEPTVLHSLGRKDARRSRTL